MAIAKSREESVIFVFKNSSNGVSICARDFMGESDQPYEFHVVECSEEIVSIPFEDLDDLISALQKIRGEWQ